MGPSASPRVMLAFPFGLGVCKPVGFKDWELWPKGSVFRGFTNVRKGLRLSSNPNIALKVVEVCIALSQEAAKTPSIVLTG